MGDRARRIEAERALRREDERVLHAWPQGVSSGRLPDGVVERDRLAEVVREQVCDILDAAAGPLLDPVCGGQVLLRTLRPRDLPVGDVPNERVPERDLPLALHRRRARRADELSPLELVQAGLDLLLRRTADRGHGPAPEDLPENGRVLEQPLALR